MDRLLTLMSVEDVARVLNISTHTVRRWASQKKLPRIKLGTRTLFDPEAVAEFVSQARAAANAALQK